jgi:hypothetical protein
MKSKEKLRERENESVFEHCNDIADGSECEPITKEKECVVLG